MFYLTCVAATIDTRHFVYPSLSRSLLMEVGLLLCGSAICLRIMAGCVCRNRGNGLIGVHEDYGCRYFRLFIFAWIAYILIHGMLSPVMEWYRTTYLCVTLLSIIVFSYGLRCGILTRRHIVNGLLMIAAAHVIAVFAQWLGILEPEDAMYPVTGFNDNPNVTAMYLAGCVPFIVQRVTDSDRRSAYVIFLTLLLISVIMLRCRTAYIGLAVETAVLLLAVRRARQALCSYKWLSITIAAVLLSVSAVKMYDMKRDSATGRMLIWHLSAQMICERPLGHGYGLFEKHYNQHQAAYFAAGGGTETERRTATYVGMAYNDYLEHGVDGGIIGMLFLAGFYVLAILMSVRRKDRSATATLSAFAVMSMTNFVTASIQPWLMAVCLASMPLTDGEYLDAGRKTSDGKFLQHLLPLLAIICTGLFIVARMTLSQVELKHLEDRIKSGGRVPDAEFAGLENRIYSSEAYWRIRARCMMSMSDYKHAIPFVKHAMMYGTSPVLCYMAHQCHTAMGEESKGITYIMDVYYTQPSLLLPKLILMKYYDSSGDTTAAISYANEILKTHTKCTNEKTKAIMRDTYHYINELNKNKQQ